MVAGGGGGGEEEVAAAEARLLELQHQDHDERFEEEISFEKVDFEIVEGNKVKNSDNPGKLIIEKKNKSFCSVRKMDLFCISIVLRKKPLSAKPRPQFMPQKILSSILWSTSIKNTIMNLLRVQWWLI